MLFYDGPRDINKHMQDRVQRFDPAGYDHDAQNLTGWRREAADAQIRQGEQEPAGDDVKPGLMARFIAALRVLFRPRVA
ncbi:MAG: hypothetical protein AB3N11_12500 [Arenibacterium sp.]